MIILAALFYLLSTTVAAPVSSTQAISTCDSANTRSLQDIVCSCFTTIFACTWVSMHPNIPSPEPEGQSFWERMKSGIGRLCRRGLVTFVVAVFIPEYIIGWAIRQRLVAGKYMRMINEHTDKKKIKMVHAFFVIMGGVHKKTNRGSYPLDRYQVASLLGVDIERRWGYPDVARKEEKWERIVLPSEAQLQDQSKSDWLAKLLVVVQTLWFVIQCVARGMERLPITELEVITLAYAVLNFSIYIAWWEKPNRVACPILITEDVKPERECNKDTPFLPSLLYITGSQDYVEMLNNDKEVPNFYNGDPERHQVHVAGFISFLLGVVFGAVHLIDWDFTFNNGMERKLWRVSSLLLTATPVAGALFIALALFVDSDRKKNTWYQLILRRLRISLVHTSPLIFVGYLAARIITIYLALRSLQFLAPEALVDVQWTRFIPHI